MTSTFLCLQPRVVMREKEKRNKNTHVNATEVYFAHSLQASALLQQPGSSEKQPERVSLRIPRSSVAPVSRCLCCAESSLPMQAAREGFPLETKQDTQWQVSAQPPPKCVLPARKQRGPVYSTESCYFTPRFIRFRFPPAVTRTSWGRSAFRGLLPVQ